MPFRQFGRGEDVGRAITKNTRWHVERASGKTLILSSTLDLKIIPGSQKAEARPVVQCSEPSKASIAM